MTAATALVVDDEPMVRHMVRRILEPEVCGVVEAEDGETALRLIQGRADSIDVVVTDLAMPGLDGFDVVEVLALHRPHLPVLCMSGNVSQLAQDRHLPVPLIHKPFTADALRDAVVQLIEQSRALGATARQQVRRASGELAASEALRERSEKAVAAAVDLVAAARALRAARAKGRKPG
jgi:DNA-binding NtrC family response regulator